MGRDPGQRLWADLAKRQGMASTYSHCNARWLCCETAIRMPTSTAVSWPSRVRCVDAARLTNSGAGMPGPWGRWYLRAHGRAISEGACYRPQHGGEIAPEVLSPCLRKQLKRDQENRGKRPLKRLGAACQVTAGRTPAGSQSYTAELPRTKLPPQQEGSSGYNQRTDSSL